MRGPTQVDEVASSLPRRSDAGLPGLRVVELTLHADRGGWSLERSRTRQYRDLIGPEARFTQGDVSRSAHHALRGLHLQPNHPQGNLVTVLRGGIWDVAVDAQQGFPAVGRWRATTLCEPQANVYRLLWIPPGFAYGFVVTSGPMLVAYQCSRVYHREDEICPKWGDPNLDIDWYLAEPVVSARDSQGLSWAVWAFGRAEG